MESRISGKVLAIVAAVKRIDPATIPCDASFDQLGFDSLDKLNMLFEVESAFDIDVPDEEARAITTVKKMIERLESRLIPQKSQGA